jgi:hypothetical protein
MKKLYTTAVVFLALVSSSAFAQSFGVRAGAVSSNLKGDAMNSIQNLVDLSNGYVSTKSRTGFYAGGFVEIPVTGIISIEPGAYYSQKGYMMEGNFAVNKLEFLSASARATLQSDYLDIPVLIKANVAKGLQVYAGPQYSHLLKSNLEVEAGALGFSLFNRDLDVSNQFNKSDWSVVGGLGYTFDNGFSVNASYDHGLTRVDRNENLKSFNRAFKVGVGFKF